MYRERLNQITVWCEREVQGIEFSRVIAVGKKLFLNLPHA